MSAAQAKPGQDHRVSTVGWMAAGIALALAALLPAGFFAIQYSALASALRTEAHIQADMVTQLVASAPDMWKFQEHRLRELMQRNVSSDEPGSVRIVDETDAEVASVGQPLGFTGITRSAQLFDSGKLVGRIEVSRSTRPLLLETAGVALLGALLGAAVFFLLRSLQRRERELKKALLLAKERTEITLRSIADAVVATTTEQTVQYLNAAAEELTGWTLAEAQGRPVLEVLRLVDEQSLEALAIPLAGAETANIDGSVRPQPSLLRRDGSRIAVEISAAPILGSDALVHGAVIAFHDVTLARGMAQRLDYQATHDGLTGLVNRVEFERRVDASIVSARNAGRDHVVCYMDLDQFKIINDTCGHPAGDELLKQLAALLHAKVRDSDTLARLGGDEFGLLLDNCPLERAELIAADLLAGVRDFRLNWEGKSFSVGVSIGLAVIGPDCGGRIEILSEADSALFAAKDHGRDRVFVYRKGDADLAARKREMGWVARIKLALEEERFTLYFMRYRQLSSGPDAGAHIEILLRMIDEEGQVLTPGTFLPAAERFNLMPQIDQWVVRTVFARYSELVTQFDGGPLTCAINLSGASINTENFFDFIREQAAIHQIPPGGICFEITETAAINNLRKASQFMKDIKGLGFLFALDDFGTGTSSFSYLKNLPVDYLKIDGGFVKDIGHDPLDKAMTETMNRIGHIMGMKTVGEFATTEEVIDELKTMGVDFAQGFGVAKPSPLPVSEKLRSPATGMATS